MNRSLTRLAALASIIILAICNAGCSGGGGGGGSGGGVAPGSSVAGTWFGTEEEMSGNLVTLSVTMDSAGNITSIVTGGQATGLTGTASLVAGQSQIYSFLLSDGTIGGFFLDSTSTYAVFVDEFFNFGVLQKGATTLPNSSASEILSKSYTGISVTVDPAFNLTSVLGSQVQVFSSGAFQGSDNGGLTFGNAGGGELFLANSLYGAWYGSYVANGPGGPGSGAVRLFLSPDKKFIGAWARDDLGFFPENCSFMVWRAN